MTHIARIAAYAGWVVALGLAALVAAMLPHMRLHFLDHFVPKDLELQRKQQSLAAAKWQDPRPLMVWLGDSHVEFGYWYDLFGGAYAVRNCGLSQATIQDVTRLVDSIPDTHPGLVVTLCGINNLLRGATVGASLEAYEALLKKSREHFQPGRIVVLAVMPVPQIVIDPKAVALNQKVAQLNIALARLCEQQDCTFLNANAAVVDEHGALRRPLTDDGLHLNREGYELLASALLPKLPH